MEKRNILLVMSDQHSWSASGFCDRRVDTPQMERIAAEGSLYESCYCTGPICVPSRMSFLTAQMPSDLEIFNNDTALASDVPTIAHRMGAMGYRTVLIGRMHFKGDDQNHGFEERLCGDITSQYWGTGGKNRTDFGDYRGTTNRKHCLKMAGGGVSPVMYFDNLVFEETMGFLEQWDQEADRRPLFLVVGFYGPHFPFVCREDLFLKYRQRIAEDRCQEEMSWPALPMYGELMQETEPEHMRDCQAAYYGLVETLDGYLGQIYDGFRESAGASPHVFCYTSDHGEQMGRRGIFGKQTFYEDSVHVPLLMAGTGIPVKRDQRPVSLLDLSRGLEAMAAGADWPGEREECRKGERWLRIQQMLTRDGKKLLAEAAVNGQFKVIRFDGSFHVYDLIRDPEERQDLMPSEEAANLIRLSCEAGCFMEERELSRLCREETLRCERQRQLTAWGETVHPVEWATVKIPPKTLIYPEQYRK